MGSAVSRSGGADPGEVAAIFFALGDPRRVALLERLATDGRGTATGLTSTTDVSRQAVDRHLRVLADAGLVSSHREGREVVYALEPQAVKGQADWLERLAATWDKRLLNLKRAAERPSEGEGS